MNRMTTALVVAGALVWTSASCADPQPKVESPIRKATNKFVTLEVEYPVMKATSKGDSLMTELGKLTLELYRDVAPAHADSFAARAADGFYNNTKFHRIIDGFMIQGGDPKGDGTGGASYNLNAEFSKLPHQDGTLSMARSNDPNSASSQFFICLGRNQQTAYLDGQYTVFGQLVNGFEVLHKIGKLPVVVAPWGEKSMPANPVILKKAYLSNASGKPLK
jgi:cyclophilin family peptidyl-prolyl cis-trans isomerase